MRLHQRHHIDIGWSDLASAVLGLAAADAAAARREISNRWPRGGATIACLSVRTAFDALLSVLDLPTGSEIVMSAINIAGMAEIAAAHGLAIRAVDIDPATLAPSADGVAAALTERTRLILIAHLFGSRIDLAPFTRFRSDRILLVEDCAQAWEPGFGGSPDADVSLFSFGPIKTLTALGGAVAVFRDAALAAAVEKRLSAYPTNSKGWFLKRIVKHGAIKAVSHPLPYGLIYRTLRFAGVDVESAMGAMARGFGSGELLPRIRRQPPAALLKLLARRLSRSADILARRDASRALMDGLPSALAPGRLAPSHSYWVTPVLVGDPNGARHALLAHGFDATLGTTSIRVLGGDAGSTPAAERMLATILYLPSVGALPQSKRDELKKLLADHPTAWTTR